MFNKIKTFLPIALCCISLVAFANENENTEKQVPQESKGLTITTKAGDTYENCRVKKVNSHSITVFHSNGIVKIPFAQLPQDIQDEYGKARKKKSLLKKYNEIKNSLNKPFEDINALEKGMVGRFTKNVEVFNVVGPSDMLVKRKWLRREDWEFRREHTSFSPYLVDGVKEALLADIKRGYFEKDLVWIKNYSTENIKDDVYWNLKGCFVVTGTKTYDTAMGGLNTVFVLKSFDKKKYLDKLKKEIGKRYKAYMEGD